MQTRSGTPGRRACPPGTPGQEDHRKDSAHVNSNHLVVLLLVAVAGVVAAQSQAWASALGTATAVYTVLSTANQDRRS